MMGTDAGATLAAQGLETSDLAANRAGRVSERQVARQVAVRRGGSLGVWIMAVGIVGGVGVGALMSTQSGDTGVTVVMAILGLGRRSAYR